MPGVGAEYARLPVTEIADDFSSEEEDDLYTRPPRRHKGKPAKNGKPSLQGAPMAFRGGEGDGREERDGDGTGNKAVICDYEPVSKH